MLPPIQHLSHPSSTSSSALVTVHPPGLAWLHRSPLYCKSKFKTDAQTGTPCGKIAQSLVSSHCCRPPPPSQLLAAGSSSNSRPVLLYTAPSRPFSQIDPSLQLVSLGPVCSRFADEATGLLTAFVIVPMPDLPLCVCSHCPKQTFQQPLLARERDAIVPNSILNSCF